MLLDVLKHLEGHDAFYDIADTVVIVRLKTVRDMYLDDIDHLNSIKPLSKFEQEDFDMLTGDVEALNRVIKLYHLEENDND